MNKQRRKILETLQREDLDVHRKWNVAMGQLDRPTRDRWEVMRRRAAMEQYGSQLPQWIQDYSHSDDEEYRNGLRIKVGEAMKEADNIAIANRIYDFIARPSEENILILIEIIKESEEGGQ